MSAAKHVVVVGVGNVGSHLIGHLALIPTVGSITIVDRDRYESRNRANQAGATPGRKAVVQARRARKLNRGIEAIPIHGDVERLPIGILAADLVVSCVDNRRTRVFLNQLTRWLGIPWIDTGVLADGRYARVTRIDPDPSSACYLCGWGPRDFALVERSWSCDGARPEPGHQPPSGTSAALGGLAASLAALEAERLLANDEAIDRPEELVISADGWHSTATRRRRNPTCPADHAQVPVAAESLSLGQPVLSAIDTASRQLGPVVSVEVLGARFATQSSCPRCGNTPTPPRVVRRGESTLTCARCRRRADVVGYGLFQRLDVGTLDRPAARRSLLAFGCRDRDILAFAGPDRALSYEVRHA